VTTLAEVRNLVSSVIDELGGDSYDSRVDKNAWSIVRNSADGLIVIFENSENAEFSDIVATFDIMAVPQSNTLAFYRRLLELNERFYGKAAFCVTPDNTVSLRAGRAILDINHSEIVDLILRTAAHADSWIAPLVQEFGG
jgi:hypothetical protein